MNPRMRQWRLNDAPDLLEISLENADLTRQIGELQDLASSERVIESWLAAVDAGQALIWAITDGEATIGCVGVTSIERNHRTGWCWYWLVAPARGHGVASRALATAASMAFEQDLYRLELGHRVNNPASCEVATRAGFDVEGVERAKLEYDGIRYDCETHARLVLDPKPNIELLEVR